ncbi:MAG: OmpA family protein [Dehalococcoidia bacterium]|nr:OmpA family protein [Dehalococcoidia bacterium]
MLRIKDIGIVAMVVATIWVLNACAGGQVEMEEVGTPVNPAEEVNRFDSEIRNAQKNQLNVLAPTSFAKAEAYLNDAKKALKSGDELSEILEPIASGYAQLQHAEEMAQVARTTLPNAIKARELARAEGATNLGEDYVRAEEQFLKLTKAIENNDLRYAQNNREKVAAAFDQLEVRAIKDQTLGEARKLIKQAEDEGARKLTPKTLEVAQQKLNDADAFISDHRYEKEKIQQKSTEALFQAQRLVQVTRQSKQVGEMQPEQLTLWVEGILSQTASKLSASDMRNKTYNTQVENILGSIAALQEDRQFIASQEKVHLEEIKSLKQQVALLEGKTQEEQAAKERLEAEKQFNELYTEVKGYFTSDEAEIYKQGNRLIIRLRAMQFPVGQAVIMPSNYGLVSKVQRSIRTFGEPDVVIEGHTDSTGSPELNEHLSQQRADSVRDYLIANGILSEDKIVAIGYGSKRPLASNETEMGRAINRRIDVVISPTPQAG